MTDQYLETQVNDIHRSIAKLERYTQQLTERQARQITRTQLITRWTAVGLVLDLALTITGVFLVAAVTRNAHVLSRQQDTLTAVQTRTSTDALCPLYEVFLRTYNTTSPAAVADPVQYERSFLVLESGARALGCAHATRGRN